MRAYSKYFPQPETTKIDLMEYYKYFINWESEKKYNLISIEL